MYIYPGHAVAEMYIELDAYVYINNWELYNNDLLVHCGRVHPMHAILYLPIHMPSTLHSGPDHFISVYIFALWDMHE